jgi:uncharacterized protein
MVRWHSWTSSIALGLLLGWPGAAAQAQLFGNPGNFGAEQYNTADDDSTSTAGDPDDMPSDPADDYRSGENSNDVNAERRDGGAADDDQSKIETIKERYPNGRVRIEREVTQDAAGNYNNHGKWKMWDDRGNGIAEGNFEHGKRTGTWVRWYRSVSEAKLLTQQPYQQFAGPFASQATFKDGQLDGMWAIYDAKQHKISEWNFSDGRRNGTSTWWYPTGRKMREVQYRDGDIDGTFLEWDVQGIATVKDTYQTGRKLAPKVAHHTGGVKKSQGMYLFARETEKTPDDWWNCSPQTTTRQGKDEKHGPWISWYGNNQRQLEGSYEHDLQCGKFTWWHSNGQKALEGEFDHGKQDGSWTWWYNTGQKSIQGHYAQGNPTGRWTWWKEDGKVTQSADLSHTEGVVIDTQGVPDLKKMPQAKKPKQTKQTVR